MRSDASWTSIRAQVVGEHGDSEVVLWSSATVGGLELRGWPGWSEAREPGLASEIRRAAYEIIRRKGATNHAIGLVTAALLRWALEPGRRVLTVSTLRPGAFGGVALSLPSIVGPTGVADVLLPEMSTAEQEALERSAEVLRRAHESLGR